MRTTGVLHWSVRRHRIRSWRALGMSTSENPACSAALRDAMLVRRICSQISSRSLASAARRYARRPMPLSRLLLFTSMAMLAWLPSSSSSTWLIHTLPTRRSPSCMCQNSPPGPLPRPLEPCPATSRTSIALTGDEPILVVNLCAARWHPKVTYVHWPAGGEDGHDEVSAHCVWNIADQHPSRELRPPAQARRQLGIYVVAGSGWWPEPDRPPIPIAGGVRDTVLKVFLENLLAFPLVGRQAPGRNAHSSRPPLAPSSCSLAIPPSCPRSEPAAPWP